MDKLFKFVAGSILLVLFLESLWLLMYTYSYGWYGWETLIIYLLIFLGMANVHLYAYIIVVDLYKNILIHIGICFLVLTIIMALSPGSLDTEFDNDFTSNIIIAFIPLLFTIPILKDKIKYRS